MVDKASKLSIAVVICAFNEQDWIAKTLASLIEQKRPADEIIVVNNASTDGTEAAVQRFMAEHPDLPVRIVNESKKGLHRARETGWRAAKSDIVVTTDADIRFPPQWLQKYEEVLLARPEISAFTGPVRYYDALFFINWVTAFFERTNVPEGIGKRWSERYYVNGGNSAYRRTALEAVDGYLDMPKGTFEDRFISTKLQDANFQVRYAWNNPVWHTFRRFNKDGWRGYMKYLFFYTAENVYPDHLADV